VVVPLQYIGSSTPPPSVSISILSSVIAPDDTVSWCANVAFGGDYERFVPRLPTTAGLVNLLRECEPVLHIARAIIRYCRSKQRDVSVPSASAVFSPGRPLPRGSSCKSPATFRYLSYLRFFRFLSTLSSGGNSLRTGDHTTVYHPLPGDNVVLWVPLGSRFL
jgi:hypothetical protein